MYFEVSALTGNGVDEMFSKMCEEALKDYVEIEKEHLDLAPAKQKTCCM